MFLFQNFIKKIMFLKKKIDKNFFDVNGFVLLDTSLSYNNLFFNLVTDIEKSLLSELKNPALKKFGGYLMGNFGINQGPYAKRLYKLVFEKEFIKYFENLTSKKLELFEINYGGNLVLPKKGIQHFHTDGKYENEMYMVSVATEDITLANGPTEICAGSHLKSMSFHEFFFSKKRKQKLLMKKGQILIRKHNLWHRGTINFSDKQRLLLSFVMIPKWRKIKIVPISSKFEILPNFFKSTLLGKMQEFFYVKMFNTHTVLKIMKSILIK